jgi:hypothetical protein
MKVLEELRKGKPAGLSLVPALMPLHVDIAR